MAERDGDRDRGAREKKDGEEREPPLGPTSAQRGAPRLHRILLTGGGRHCAEGRILAQDRVLQATEFFCRLEPELGHELVPAFPIDLQRVSLAAAAIEREHELRPEALAQ